MPWECKAAITEALGLGQTHAKLGYLGMNREGVGVGALSAPIAEIAVIARNRRNRTLPRAAVPHVHRQNLRQSGTGMNRERMGSPTSRLIGKPRLITAMDTRSTPLSQAKGRSGQAVEHGRR